MRAWRTAGYVMAGAAVIAGIAIVLLDDDEPEEVSLPPIRETELADAARRAGCELRRTEHESGPILPSTDRRRPRPRGPASTTSHRTALLSSPRCGTA